jgi:putative MATE family efflux protein
MSLPPFRPRGLWQLAWPLCLFSALTALTSVVDAMLVSGYSQELAATVSVANQLLGVGYDLSALFSIGALVVVSRHLGAGEIEAARRAGLVAIGCAAGLGALVAALHVAGAGKMVTLANTPPEIAADARVYVAVTGVSFVFNGVITAGAAVLRGFGRTREILVLGVLGNALYLFLEYTLIAGRLGFPELGVWGSAGSSLLVRGAGVVLLGWVLVRRLGFGRADLRWSGGEPAGGIARRLLRLSGASTAENVAADFAQIVLIAGVATLGTAAVLTRSYALTLAMPLPFLLNALHQANETLVGYDRGAGDHAGARRRLRRNGLITVGLTTALAAPLWLWGEELAGLFTDDAAVRGGVREVLFIAVWMQPFSALGVLLLGSLRSSGDAVWPPLWNLGVTWGLTVPLALWATKRPEYGIVGFWWALAVGEAVKSAGLALRWRTRRWPVATSERGGAAA